jgi:alpha-amylase/alpha-mannosidase (GH57 family)
MPTSRPLHVAFVWHMHQPYYRSARSGAFEMPWARMHALKDYLDMVDRLADYPELHQTFNLVPSLVEQLQDYSSGTYRDVYWEHTLKPAIQLDPAERAFVVERLCEPADHPRARSHPRYLELARKRESLAPQGWGAAAKAFSVQELRDLQVWFNLAWFGSSALTDPALSDLLMRGREFREDDKSVLARCQASILSRILPAYREAAARGQVELTTSPYFHPILPLLCDTDSARIASPDLRLPPRRFAHPEDGSEQLRAAMAKHRDVFGEAPRGIWCSEMAVGEAVLPLLMDLGACWTISDESVLARSLSGVSAGHDQSRSPGFGTPYWPYRLVRESGEMAIVFRDHALSDLIGFTYRSWDSREAAADLISRLRDLQRTLPTTLPAHVTPPAADGGRASRHGHQAVSPLVVIALDGENAWEYYSNGGHDFLGFLYEALSADQSLRAVTVSEHLRESPPAFSLDWLHTGSWVSADLTTWCGAGAQNAAWDHLHRARDLVARRRDKVEEGEGPFVPVGPQGPHEAVKEAWRQVLTVEGSDWLWWFGDHHHTELDAVWDQDFRLRLQEIYRLLGEPVPAALLLPLFEAPGSLGPMMPLGPISPVIDGSSADPAEWELAGRLMPSPLPAMQPSAVVEVREVRFGWSGERLCVLLSVEASSMQEGLWLELALPREDGREEPVVRVTLRDGGQAIVTPLRSGFVPESVRVAWRDVVEMSLPSGLCASRDAEQGLVLRVGRGQMTAQEFRY